MGMSLQRCLKEAAHFALGVLENKGKQVQQRNGEQQAVHHRNQSYYKTRQRISSSWPVDDVVAVEHVEAASRRGAKCVRISKVRGA